MSRVLKGAVRKLTHQLVARIQLLLQIVEALHPIIG